MILSLGESIYHLLGGRGETLGHALRYSNIVFGGAIAVWIANTLSSVLRGSGNMLTPALTLIGAAVSSPTAFRDPRGPHRHRRRWNRVCDDFRHRRARHGGDRVPALERAAPAARGLGLEWRLFREILRVGAISC